MDEAATAATAGTRPRHEASALLNLHHLVTKVHAVTDLAEVLTNRLAVREQTLVVLQQRQSDVLPRLAAFCAEHGAAA